jgi:hypothetical protein
MKQSISSAFSRGSLLRTVSLRQSTQRSLSRKEDDSGGKLRRGVVHRNTSRQSSVASIGSSRTQQTFEDLLSDDDEKQSSKPLNISDSRTDHAKSSMEVDFENESEEVEDKIFSSYDEVPAETNGTPNIEENNRDVPRKRRGL